MTHVDLSSLQNWIFDGSISFSLFIPPFLFFLFCFILFLFCFWLAAVQYFCNGRLQSVLHAPLSYESFSGQPDGDKKQTYQCHYVPAPFSSTGPFQKNTWELSRKLQPALWHDRRRSRMQCWGFCGKYFVLEKVYPNSIHNSYPISYILTLSYNSIHFQKRGKNWT